MTTTAEGPTLREVLLDDHARLSERFEELTNAARVGVDKRTLCEIWTRFDHELTAHLAAEEQALFPRLIARHPAEVASLRLDHDRIRVKSAEIGIEIELGMVREPTVQALVTMLRKHAAREEATLYRWADQLVEPAEHPSLIARLRRRHQEDGPR